MPRVTDIIPCYNSADSVRRAIDSVLAQMCFDLELVVVDDVSTINLLREIYGCRQCVDLWLERVP